MNTQQIHRLPQVIEIVGLRRSTIYAKVATGEFPRPVRLGRRSVGWLASDVQDWITRQIASSRITEAATSAGNKSLAEAA